MADRKEVWALSIIEELISTGAKRIFVAACKDGVGGWPRGFAVDGQKGHLLRLPTVNRQQSTASG